MSRQKDNNMWKKGFGQVLKAVFDSFEIDYKDYAQNHFINPSTIRYWFIGRSAKILGVYCAYCTIVII